MKRLYKSKKNRVLSGVLGGIGEYFNVDPVLLRLLWLIVVGFTGFFPGVIVYFFACLIVPRKPK